MTRKKKKHVELTPEDARKTAAYRRGAVAYVAGHSIDSCPHIVGSWNPRFCWLTGFLDARTNDRLGHIFRKHGMTHP